MQQATGAALPAGADAVVKHEDVVESADGRVARVPAAEPGTDVRQVGANTHTHTPARVETRYIER